MTTLSATATKLLNLHYAILGSQPTLAQLNTYVGEYNKARAAGSSVDEATDAIATHILESAAAVNSLMPNLVSEKVLATAILANVGISNASIIDFITKALDGSLLGFAFPLNQTVRVVSEYVANYTTGAAADPTWDADLVAAQAIVAARPVPQAVGQSFTLTTSIDAFAGGSGPDVFSGVVDGTTPTVTTLNAGDNLTGGAGMDRLVVAAQGAASTISGVTTNGVDTVQIQSVQTGGTTTFDALLTTGMTDVAVTGSNTAVSVTNLQTIPNLSLSSNNANVTVGFRSAATVVGETDAMKIALNGNNTAAGSTITANGIETVNVTSSGAASGSSTRPVTIASSTLNKVVVDGSAGLTAAFTLAGAVVPGKPGMVDLSASTASSLGMTVTAGSNAQTQIMGSAGADSLTITPGGGELTVTGGAGNDTVRIDGTTFSSKTSIDGGDGTNTLNLTKAVSSATNAAGIKGFQTLGAYDSTTVTGVTGGSNPPGTSRTLTQDVSVMSAAPSKVQVSTWALSSSSTTASALSDTITFSGLSSATTDLAIGGVSVSTSAPSDWAANTSVTTAVAGGATSVALAVTASLKVDTAADSLNVTLGSASGSAVSVSQGSAVANKATTPVNFTPALPTATLSLNVANYETVTLTSNSDVITSGNTLTDLVATSTKTLNIGAGSAPLTISNTSANAPSALTTIDASAATQAFNMSGMTLGSAKALTVTGGAGNDTLKGTALSDNVSGGAGFDTITGGGGNDTLSGGDGNDSLTGGSGADSISGGEGVDTITGAGGNDVLDGGAGNDLFVASVSTAANTSGGETVNFSSATKIIGGDGSDTLRLAGAVSSATNYNLDFSAAAESRFTGVSGIETIQLGSFTDAASTPAAKDVTLKLGDIAMGSFGGSVSVGVLSTATIGTVTVDASSVLNSSSTVKYTGLATKTSHYTVGNNIDNVTLGTASDTVTVGNAIFLSAADSIDAGLGTDTLKVSQGSSTTVAFSTATLANVKGFETLTADFGLTSSGSASTGGLSFTLSDEFAAANRTSTDSKLTIKVNEGGGTGALTLDGKAVTASTSLVVQSSQRADALTGGAGNDVFVSPLANTLNNGESITGGEGTDVLQLHSTGANDNSLNGVTLSSIEGIQFGDPDASTGAVTLSALASVFNGATFTVAEVDTSNSVNVIKLTANGASVFDFSKVTAVAYGTSQTTASSANDTLTISFDSGQDGLIAHTYTGSGLSDVVTMTSTTGTSATAVAVSDTISGGAGNDVFVYATHDRGTNASNDLRNLVTGTAVNASSAFASSGDFIDVVNGGSGTDTLRLDSSSSAAMDFNSDNALAISTWSKFSSVETIAINGTVASGVTITLPTAAYTAGFRNVDLSVTTGTNTVSMANATATQATSVTGGNGVDNITGGLGNDVISGGGGADVINGGTGIDVITGGADADQITTGTGADAVVVTVIATADTVADFTSGAGGDQIRFDISDLVNGGLVVLKDGNSAAIVAASSPPVVKAIPAAATTVAAGDEIFALTGATYANSAALELAIESSGTSAITLGTASTIGDDYLVVWSDGVNGHVGFYNAATAATTFAAAGTYTELVTLTGVSTAAAVAAFVAENFDFVA